MNAERRFSKVHLAGASLLIATLGTVGVLLAAQHAGLNKEASQRKAELEAGPRVRTARASGGGGARTTVLQGEALPFTATTLFAKVSGFLREVRVDKGSRVKQGELLAVLVSPELERQTQALKDDADNKQRIAERARQLRAQGVLSSQDQENAETASKVAKETLGSQLAQDAYLRVTAPFSGIITQRFADPGAMVQNGGNSTAAQPLLALAQVDRLRVTFYLDQALASQVKVGLELEVRASDRLELARQAKIARVAGALDARTRTLLVEADLDNHDGAFLPGGAVQVSLRVTGRQGQLAVPLEALALRNGQPCVALVGADGRVSFMKVVLGEEGPNTVSILQGIKEGTRVVLNPGAGLKEGDRVQALDL
jgi:RND family efflux transporter MFP subunit